jgi:hypothetical protein
VYRDDLAGWLVRTPDQWKYAVQGATVLFGSDTEAGIILVALTPGVTYAQMEAGIDAYIAQLGATQLGPAKPFSARAGKALVVEMSGTLPDGTNLNARSIGVAGAGGILSITGITTPDKLAGLRRRVDQLAQSVQFFAPQRTAAMTVLAGPWWHYHSTGAGTSGSSSYERTIELCANGTFFDSDESNINVGSGDKNIWAGRSTDSVSAFYNRAGGGAGRWTATGDRARGQLRLQFNNGKIEQHGYVFVKQGDIELDGRWYGHARDKGGRCR